VQLQLSFLSSQGNLYGGGRPAPHIARGLSTIGPNMTELLTVKAPSQNSLSSIGLNPDHNMAEGGQFKHFQCFLISCVTRNNGILNG
jgi:hypothetical protein